MCGIVGLLVKKPALREQLGELMLPMLIGMTERGPDSAGLAVFTEPRRRERSASSVSTRAAPTSTGRRSSTARQALGADATLEAIRPTTRFSIRSPSRRTGEALDARPLSAAARAVGRARHRPLQGHRRAGRSGRTLRLRLARRHASRRPYAHGDRVGGDARPCASVHRGRGLLPGPQRVAVESVLDPPPARAARHRVRHRQRHRGGLPLPRMAHARGRRAGSRAAEGLRRARRLLHLSDGDERRAGAGARRVRLQAGDRRRDRRLRGDLVGVPLAREAART